MFPVYFMNKGAICIFFHNSLVALQSEAVLPVGGSGAGELTTFLTNQIEFFWRCGSNPPSFPGMFVFSNPNLLLSLCGQSLSTANNLVPVVLEEALLKSLCGLTTLV